MTPVTLSPEPNEDVAELLERLGNIPASRIRMRPPPGTATEEDVIAALEAPRKRICELIDGVLVEKAMGWSEALLALYFGGLLRDYVRRQHLGMVVGPDGTIALWPGRVRIPDVAFFSWARLPNRRRPLEPIPILAPDLAVEFLSISNTSAEMRLKRRDYFASGVLLVWEFDPRARTVTVYTSADTADAVLTEDQRLDAGAVVPGFSLSLGDLFAELDQHD
jgi:Uma2 family endonuclease